MRAPMPRLVKDGKSGIWFFRWSLPRHLQQSLQKQTLYITLQTRDARLAQCCAALLNLRVEAMKKIPDLDEDRVRKLLEIDAAKGIFKADTTEEQERGLRVLEQLTRLQSQFLPGQAVTIQSSADTQPQKVAPKAAPSHLFRAVADEHLRDLGLSLKKASLDKYKSTFDLFQKMNGN